MRFMIYKDSGGLWRWRLMAVNNRIIACSAEAYFNLADCENGVHLVMGTDNKTELRNLTLKKK